MSGLTQVKFTRLDRQYTLIRDEVLPTIDSILSSGQLMDGPYTAKFEEEMAKATGYAYAVSCHSGTQALEFMLRYYRQTLNHKPILLAPTVTFPATINAAIRVGWHVHLVDVGKEGIIDLQSVDWSQFNVPVSLLLVGLYGQTRNLRKYLAFLQQMRFKGAIEYVFEDAAQHLFADTLKWEIDSVAALSFDPTKNLASNGNGGMVLTDCLPLSDWLKSHRSNGKPDFNIVGTNSRLNEIDAATLSIKLKYMPQWQTRRKEIAMYWLDKFKDHAITTLVTEKNITDHALQKFVIRLDDRDTLKQKLQDDGIETRIHYPKAMHELNAFSDLPGPGIMSVGSALCRQVLSLPLYSELTDSEVEFIAERVVLHTKY